MTSRAPRLGRAHFARFQPILTRWMDNDAYGHVNNVVYYSYFDTIVNRALVAETGLDVRESPVIGLVVETGCTYFESVAFPEDLEGALAVAGLGRSSVRYRVAIFRPGAELPAAQGHFVHVYVDRASGRPVGIPAETRAALARLERPGEG